eukprot:g59709.t1
MRFGSGPPFWLHTPRSAKESKCFLTTALVADHSPQKEKGKKKKTFGIEKVQLQSWIEAMPPKAKKKRSVKSRSPHHRHKTTEYSSEPSSPAPEEHKTLDLSGYGTSEGDPLPAPLAQLVLRYAADERFLLSCVADMSEDEARGFLAKAEALSEDRLYRQCNRGFAEGDAVDLKEHPWIAKLSLNHVRIDSETSGLTGSGSVEAQFSFFLRDSASGASFIAEGPPKGIEVMLTMHANGDLNGDYDGDYDGSFSFFQTDGPGDSGLPIVEVEEESLYWDDLEAWLLQNKQSSEQTLKQSRMACEKWGEYVKCTGPQFVQGLLIAMRWLVNKIEASAQWPTMNIFRQFFPIAANTRRDRQLNESYKQAMKVGKPSMGNKTVSLPRTRPALQEALEEEVDEEEYEDEEEEEEFEEGEVRESEGILQPSQHEASVSQAREAPESVESVESASREREKSVESAEKAGSAA